MSTKLAVLLASLLVTSASTGFASMAQEQAQRAFAAGDFDRAEQLYRNELSRAPHSAHVLARLGELALFNDRLPQATSLLERSLAVDPTDKIAQLDLADAKARSLVSDKFRANSLVQPVVVPLVAVDPLPVVKVRLNGRRDAYFLLDTGAPGIVCDPALIGALHAPLQSAGAGVFAGGRQTHVDRAELASVEIGSAEVRDVPVSVVSMAGAPSPKNVHVEGIIGTPFLYRFLATVDYARARLILAPRADAAAFERKARKDGVAVSRMWLVGDHFLFARAVVNRHLQGLFNVDTGGDGFGVQLAKSVLKQAHVATDMAHVTTMSGPGGDVRSAPFVAAVRMGKYERGSVRGTVTLDGDQYGIFPFAVSGTLSHEFFTRHAVTFDFAAMKIFVR